MKLFTRVKSVLVLALLAALLAGPAWAVAQSTGDIENRITSYNSSGGGTGSLSTSVSGNTVTIGNSKTGATQTLNLGDISGLTINWEAALTGDISGRTSNFDLIRMSGSGIFNINSGAVLRFTGTDAGGRYGFLVRSDVANSGNLQIHVRSGALLETDRPRRIAIDWDGEDDRDSSHAHQVFIHSGGTIRVPYDIAALGQISIESGAESGITGVVMDINTMIATIYGNYEQGREYREEVPFTWKVWSGASFKIGDAWSFDVPAAASLINEGTINIYGTLKNAGAATNNGTIINHSGNTLDNQGTLTNNGTIINKSTGRIRNTGTIVNTNGTINNEGVFQSTQTKEQMGGTVNGEVQPIQGGGSGCDAGYGAAALLLAGLAALKRRKP